MAFSRYTIIALLCAASAPAYAQNILPSSSMNSAERIRALSEMKKAHGELEAISESNGGVIATVLFANEEPTNLDELKAALGPFEAKSNKRARYKVTLFVPVDHPSEGYLGKVTIVMRDMGISKKRIKTAKQPTQIDDGMYRVTVAYSNDARKDDSEE